MLHLVHQNIVQFPNILLNVGLWFLYILQQVHVLLYYVDYVVNVLSVLRDETLLVLQYHLDQVLVVSTNPFKVVTIVSFDLFIGLERHFFQWSQFLKQIFWLCPLIICLCLSCRLQMKLVLLVPLWTSVTCHRAIWFVLR